MAIEITIPRLGWSMEEGTFSEWLIGDGAMVRSGDLLYTLETDKVTQEVESLDEGLLHIADDSPKAGDKVDVGQRIGYLLAPGEPAPAQVLTPLHLVTPAETTLAVATPRARRIAQELGIDWTRLPGSGRHGRIREADVRLAAAARPSLSASGSSTRRTIAAQMLTSQERTAPVTLHTTADATALVTALVTLRQSRQFAYHDLFLKLTALALHRHPVLNSRWEGEHLVTQSATHIGLAVDTEAGLLVPVIRDVDRLSLAEVATRTRELVERARNRRLRSEDLTGGTFSLTNLGSFGIDAFTPVIHYPECAILGVGRIQRQPVAVGDAIGLRDIVALSLTFDHCALDGAPAARFLQTLTRLIESPAASLGLDS